MGVEERMHGCVEKLNILTQETTAKEQLIKEMGEDSYNDLTNGQKALVNAYRASKQQSVLDRKDHAYRDCKVNLYDTSDVEGNDDSDPTGLMHRIMETDFWPASYQKSGDIRIGSAHFSNQTNPEEAKSVFVHDSLLVDLRYTAF